MGMRQYLKIFAGITAFAVLGTAGQYAAEHSITLGSIVRDVRDQLGRARTTETPEEQLNVDFTIEKAIRDGDRLMVQVAVRPERAEEFLPVPVWFDRKTESVNSLNPEYTPEEEKQLEHEMKGTSHSIEDYAKSKNKKPLPVRVQLRDVGEPDSGYRLSKDGTLYWSFIAEDESISSLRKLVCETAVQPTGESGESKKIVSGTQETELTDSPGKLLSSFAPASSGKIEGTDLTVKRAECRAFPEGIEVTVYYRYSGKLNDRKKINSYLYNHYFLAEDQRQELSEDMDWEMLGMDKTDSEYNTSAYFRYYGLEMPSELCLRVCDWTEDEGLAQGHIRLKAEK